MKKLLSLVLAVLMLTLVLAGCTGSGTPAGAGKQLVVQVGPNPESIDPAMNTTVDGACMIIHAFECLITIAEDGSYQPGQAESWEVSDDGLTWTFHLREGLKWSDGTAITANDFVYSWQRVADPEMAFPYAETVLAMVKGWDEAVNGDPTALAVSAPDDLTFVVELSTPTPYFEGLASFPTLSPVQQATIDANGDAWAVEADTYVSNGPLMITEWVPSSHITMSKNPNYWNADAITLDSIKFMLIEDANASYSAYQSGEVLMIKDVPIEEVASLQGNPEYHLDPLLGTYYISMRNQEGPLSDPLVRKALSLAVDRTYIAYTIMQGTYLPAGNIVSPGITDYDGSQFIDNANGGQPYNPLTADMEAAKALLAQAGYPNGEGLGDIQYVTNDSAYHKPVAEYLQQVWGELGLTVNVEIAEWATFSADRRSGAFMAARNGWIADYNDPTSFLDIFVTGGGNNDGKYSNPVYDAALEAARNAATSEERFAALHEAEDTLMADAGIIPLAYYSEFYLVSANVTGWWFSPDGNWHFMYADIVDAA